MKIEKKEIPGSRILFQITIEWDVVKESLKKAYDGMERIVRTDGFRKGKIPRYILEARFSEEASEESINRLIRKTAEEILEKENIKPLAGPWVADVNFQKEAPLSFKIEVEVLPDFEIPNYRDIKLSDKKIKIDDKEIERHLEVLRKDKGDLKEKEGRIKRGDIAVVDLVAYLPSGKPVEHHGLYIEIGSSDSPSDFPEVLENELIGMAKNEEKTFEIKMPSNTKDKNLAEVTVRFKMQVLGVKEKLLPKLDDDFAKKVGDFKNIKALKERIRENLTKIEEEKEKENMKTQMIEELLKRTPFDAPETLVIEEYERMLGAFFYNLESKNISFERFLSEQNKTEEAFCKELKLEAEKKIKALLILERIAGLENISVSDVEYEEWVKMNFEEGAIEEALYSDKRKTLEKDLRIEKTLEFLVKR